MTSFTQPPQPVPSGIGNPSSFVVAGIEATQIVGNGPAGFDTTNATVPFVMSQSITNPSKLFNQAFSALNFASGDQQAGAGTIEGGSAQAQIFANGVADWTVPAVGFEGIGEGSGNAGRTLPLVIGLLGTSLASNGVNVTKLVSIRGAAPTVIAGYTGTVPEADTLELFEPLVGTVRRAMRSTGIHHLLQGVNSNNVVEVASQADVLRWAILGTAVLNGFASDGASIRFTLDTNDTPTNGRINSGLFGTGKHMSLNNVGSEVLAVSFDGTLRYYKNTTGAGTALLGTNSPAVTNTAPYTWLTMTSSDGSTVYIPAWK